MKISMFHLMPYRHADLDAIDKNGSAWVTFSNSHYDPERGAGLYHEYLDQMELADRLGFPVLADPLSQLRGGSLTVQWPDGQVQAFGDPQGAIHADLFRDNVLFEAHAPGAPVRLAGVIDFYFACNDFLAYDVAICLNAWCFEPDNAFNATKARALLQAYDRVRPLEPEERRLLPLLARGSALRFLLTRLYDWVHTPAGALVKRKDPNEYLAKLRFHRSVKSLADYGL